MPIVKPAEWLRGLLPLVQQRRGGSAMGGLAPDELHNGQLLRLEGVFAGLIFGGLAAFYALYAIQLGASNATIGWLTSAPALVSLVWQFPVSRLIGRFRTYRAPIVTGIVLHRLVIMALAVVIWLPAAWRPAGVVILVALSALPSSLWGIAFQAAWVVMFSPRRLAGVVGLRWAVASVTTMVSVYLLGLWLDLIVFPLNFQIMFVAVGLLALASVWIIGRFRFPPLQPAPALLESRPVDTPSTKREWVRRYRSFFTLEATAFVAYVAVYGATPLYRIYWLRDLQANATWLGLLTAAFSVGGALGNWLWGRWSHPARNRRNVLITCLGFASLYPLLTAAFDSLLPLVFVNLLCGFVAGGNDLMLLNRSMELSNRQQLPTFVAIYALTINLASFLAPLATTSLTSLWDTRVLLIAVGAFGLLGVGLVVGVGWGKPSLQESSA